MSSAYAWSNLGHAALFYSFANNPIGVSIGESEMSDNRIFPSAKSILSNLIEGAQQGKKESLYLLNNLATFYDESQDRNMWLSTNSDYRVLMFCEKENGASYVLCELPGNKLHPFVVWDLGYMPDGSRRAPSNGAYCETRKEAYGEFLHRINR